MSLWPQKTSDNGFSVVLFVFRFEDYNFNSNNLNVYQIINIRFNAGIGFGNFQLKSENRKNIILLVLHWMFIVNHQCFD